MDEAFDDIADSDVTGAKAFLAQFPRERWRAATYPQMLESVMRYLGYTCLGTNTPAPQPHGPDTLDLEPALPQARRDDIRAWLFHHTERGDWALTCHTAPTPTSATTQPETLNLINIPATLGDHEATLRARDVEGLILRVLNTENLLAKPHLLAAVHRLARLTNQSIESIDLLAGLLAARHSLNEVLALPSLEWLGPLDESELVHPMSDYIDLYHRTSAAAAAALYAGRSWSSAENTQEAWFSTHPDKHISGYGDALVHIRIPKAWLDSYNVRLDDEFNLGQGPDGEDEWEYHYAIKVDMLTPDLIIHPTD